MVTIIQKLLTLVVVFILFAFLSSCQEEQKKEIVTEKIIPPEQIIPISEAKSLHANYTERRLPLIQKYEDSINRERGIAKNFNASRYVSYDYKTIKQYLTFIENEAAKADVDISTLRFYFSNYPDKHFFDNKDSIVHPRQNSIMLSPTLKKGDRDYLFYIGGTQAQPILLSDNFGEIKGLGVNEKRPKSQASIVPNFLEPKPILYKETSLTMNRGGGSPPPQLQ